MHFYYCTEITYYEILSPYIVYIQNKYHVQVVNTKYRYIIRIYINFRTHGIYALYTSSYSHMYIVLSPDADIASLVQLRIARVVNINGSLLILYVGAPDFL